MALGDVDGVVRHHRPGVVEVGRTPRELVPVDRETERIDRLACLCHDLWPCAVARDDSDAVRHATSSNVGNGRAPVERAAGESGDAVGECERIREPPTVHECREQGSVEDIARAERADQPFDGRRSGLDGAVGAVGAAALSASGDHDELARRRRALRRRCRRLVPALPASAHRGRPVQVEARDRIAAVDGEPHVARHSRITRVVDVHPLGRPAELERSLGQRERRQRAGIVDDRPVGVADEDRALGRAGTGDHRAHCEMSTPSAARPSRIASPVSSSPTAPTNATSDVESSERDGGRRRRAAARDSELGGDDAVVGGRMARDARRSSRAWPARCRRPGSSRGRRGYEALRSRLSPVSAEKK